MAALRDVLEDARRLGLLGPDPVERHIAHALTWAASLEPQRFLDLGSGAGLPGLVLAHSWPGTFGTLLDSQLRRTAWLRTAIVRLNLTDRITVVEGRAEDLGHDPELRERFPLVVARAFGPPPTTAECAAAFVCPGGTVSVSEPPDAPDRWPIEPLRGIGLGIPRQVVHDGVSFVILPKDSTLGSEFPRRRNRLNRDPLW